MTDRDADHPDAYALALDEQIQLFLDEHRRSLAACLDGLSEGQARARLVASRTTLLGLVKHATFVERVWFEQAFTRQPRSVLGIEAGPDESFQLADDDTINSVRATYLTVCERSRAAVADKTLNDVVTGNRRGELPLRWILLQVLRGLAQHCGHADILREQILATPDQAQESATRPGSNAGRADADGGADQPAEAFRGSVRLFLAERFPERPALSGPSLLGVGSSLDDVEAGRQALALLGPGGLSVPSWPREHGGAGLSPAERAVLAEELAAREIPDLYPFAVGLNMVGPVLIHHGSSEQQHRWLGGIRDGREIWCQLFSEPNAGSDLASLTTLAVRDGDEWRVNGQKVWSSRAQYSDWGFLLARTDNSVAKHAGLTAFALDMRTAGVTVRPLRQMNRDEHFSEVFLDEVRIRDEDRIAAAGDGWKVAITTLMHERAAVGRTAGITDRDVVELLRAHRGTVTAPQRDRAVQAIISIEVQRLSRLRAQTRAVRGEAPGPEGSGAKLLWGRTVKEITSLALELQGPHGTLEGGDWVPLFLTAPSLSIRGGTDQIQQNIVGERVLGLPKEPAPAAPATVVSQTAGRAGTGGQASDG